MPPLPLDPKVTSKSVKMSLILKLLPEIIQDSIEQQERKEMRASTTGYDSDSTVDLESQESSQLSLSQRVVKRRHSEPAQAPVSYDSPEWL